MKNEKKIILFIVEGTTDEDYIRTILAYLFNKYPQVGQTIKQKFVFEFYVRSDMTSDESIDSANIEGELKKCINNKLGHTFRWSDLAQVVQLCDLDGAYIPNDRIFVGDGDFYYTENSIKYFNVDVVRQRNGLKRNRLKTLINKTKINDVPYRIYFMSCNTEHVFWGEQYRNAVKKSKLSTDFMTQREDSLEESMNLFFHSEIASTDYNQSWQEVKEGINSLQRKTNFNLFFDRLMQLAQ